MKSSYVVVTIHHLQDNDYSINCYGSGSKYDAEVEAEALSAGNDNLAAVVCGLDPFEEDNDYAV